MRALQILLAILRIIVVFIFTTATVALYIFWCMVCAQLAFALYSWFAGLFRGE